MEQQNFSLVVEQHRPSLLAHAFKLTSDEDDAKDLLQDTLIKGVLNCSKFDEGTNLLGWLFIIMKNTFYNQYNKQKRRSTIWEGSDFLYDLKLQNSSVGNLSETRYALDDVRKAMSTLKEEYRTAFQRYFEGYSYLEIASELKVPLGTVKNNIFHARKGLKKHLWNYR